MEHILWTNGHDYGYERKHKLMKKICAFRPSFKLCWFDLKYFNWVFTLSLFLLPFILGFFVLIFNQCHMSTEAVYLDRVDRFLFPLTGPYHRYYMSFSTSVWDIKIRVGAAFSRGKVLPSRWSTLNNLRYIKLFRNLVLYAFP